MRLIATFFLFASLAAAQIKPGTNPMAVGTSGHSGDVQMPKLDGCKTLYITIDPKVSEPKAACMAYVPLVDVRIIGATRFYIWDATDIDHGSLYTAIYPSNSVQKIVVKRPRWGLGLVKRRKTLSVPQQGMYIAGLPGHVIHWAVN